MQNESWDSDRGTPAEKLYLLKPTNLIINLAMCFICDDPRLPHMKIDARLPLISLHFVGPYISYLVQNNQQLHKNR